MTLMKTCDNQNVRQISVYHYHFDLDISGHTNWSPAGVKEGEQ